MKLIHQKIIFLLLFSLMGNLSFANQNSTWQITHQAPSPDISLQNAIHIQDHQFEPTPEPHGETSRILIFVSFSMSDQNLKSWMREANQIKAPLIIRGLVNNSIRDTANRIKKIAPKVGGFSIDPVAFQKFNIQTVPAVVFVKSPNSLVNSETIMTPKDFDIVYGNIHLKEALEVFLDHVSDNSKFNTLLTEDIAILNGETHETIQ